MKILFLSHRIPWPPTKGEKLRSFNQIRLLARRHEIDLLTLSHEAGEGVLAEALESYCRRVEVFPCPKAAALTRCLLACLGRSPFTLAYFRSRKLAQRAEQLIASENYDAVFISTAAMGPYARSARAPRLLDLMDADSDKWFRLARVTEGPKRWIYDIEAQRMRSLEADLISESYRSFVVNGRERERLESRLHGRVDVLSNGAPSPVPGLSELEKAPSPTLAFVGTMSYQPSVDAVCHFAHEVMPSLRQQYPDLEFWIVGRSPKPEVCRLRELPGVTVTGTVPTVETYLRRAWIFVAPHRVAPGLQNKILEAMQLDLPVVCSPACFEGLTEGRFEPGRDLLLATTPAEWHTAVSTLIQAPELRESMPKSAREKLRSTYSWDHVGEQLEEILTELAPFAESQEIRPLRQAG